MLWAKILNKASFIPLIAKANSQASAFKYCDWMKVLAASLRKLAFAMSGKEA
jgi:hypothetical protein